MEVKDLLRIEREYIASHKESDYIFNDNGGIESFYLNDELSFLKTGYLEKHYQSIDEKLKLDLRNKGLNEFETLMLVCFEGYLSYAFKWRTYEDKPSPIMEMCKGLDAVLDKSPTFKGSILYRFCTLDDRLDFKEGEIFTVAHYVTTTIDCWRCNGNMYIITPKSNKSNAKEIYKLRNKADENQVTFRRNTKFRIVKIEEEEYKKIYMQEI